jgi:hypothetical protein
MVNEDGTPVLIEAVYYRYHQVYIKEFDSIEEAQQMLEGGEDYGSLSSVGVFIDGEPHSTGPWDWVPAGTETERRPMGWLREEYVKAKAIR